MCYEECIELLLTEYEKLKQNKTVSLVDRMKPLQKIYILSLIRIKTLLENESSKSV